MKQIIFTMCLLLLTNCISAQDTNELSTMINNSLSNFIEGLDDSRPLEIHKPPSLWDKPAFLRNIEDKYVKDIYILIEYYPHYFSFSNELLEKKYKYNYKYADITSLAKKRVSKNGVAVLIFNGTHIFKDKLVIRFSVWKLFFLKKNSISLAMSISEEFIYKYSCEKNEWIFEEKNRLR